MKDFKKDFETWLRENKEVHSEVYFVDAPFSMQWGVYVDFFDSVGINIILTLEFDYGYEILDRRYEQIDYVIKWYDTRQEARQEALKKAIEIYES